jgi:hypothetical protein
MRNAGKNALRYAVMAFLCTSAHAQDALPVSPYKAMQNIEVRTGKERLGRKWTDEQRIDNCNVPPDKRGTKPRSSVCSHSPSS